MIPMEAVTGVANQGGSGVCSPCSVLQGGPEIEPDVKWCCSTFRDRYGVAGEPGIAVIADRGVEDRVEFYLQARAIRQGESIPVALPISVTIATEFVLHFCPWCGVPLRKWYRKSGEMLIRPGLKIPIE